MATCSGSLDIESTQAQITRKALIAEVRNGLVTRPHSLSPWMFYDARGSRLFERITALPEYYPTRMERGILVQNADTIIAATLAETSRKLRMLELGAGVASKTELLLEAAVRAEAEVLYIPIDVSQEALEVTCRNLGLAFPEIRTEPLVSNYVAQAPHLDAFDGATIALYLGSSIGNFSPREATGILRNLGRHLGRRDALILGVDRVKDIATMVSAYNDKEGVTGAFNLNVLCRLNKDLDADFDIGSFVHRALWNPAESRIEMHLESIREQSVFITSASLKVDFLEGETIHTENSYKFTDQSVSELLADSGFEIEDVWQDEREWCAVILARPTGDCS